LTLINSILDSIPTYFMSLFPIRDKILKRLDKIRRDFLWEGIQGNSESHKLHLVKWPFVTLPKHLGGLSIKDLAIHSNCMLMKWHSRFTQEEDVGLWKKVIVAKHGSNTQWCTKQFTLPYRTGLWKAINTLWDDFFKQTHFEVGNGNHIKFC